MKKIHGDLQWAIQTLEKAGITDPKLSAEILLGFVTGLSKIQLIQSQDAEFSNADSEIFHSLIQKRASHFPIAYLIGEKEFYSMNFHVNPSVLIPRPETEILIDWFGKEIGNRDVSVCDVGTGSGAIAITFKKQFPRIHVTALDISEKSLAIAKKNAERHGVEIEFLCSNLLENIEKKFDVVVANLPYIPESDLPGLSRDVTFEPKLALDGGPDGLNLYRQLIPQLKKNLSSNGHVFVEYGMGQTEELKNIFLNQGFSNLEVQKDYAGIDRHMHAMKDG